MRNQIYKLILNIGASALISLVTQDGQMLPYMQLMSEVGVTLQIQSALRPSPEHIIPAGGRLN